MKKEIPPEIIEAFEKGQQELCDNFKLKLKSVMEDVMGTFYTDIAPNAYADATVNFRNMYRDELTDEFKKTIVSDYSYYSWPHSMRMYLLKHHKEEISNKIIEDLQDRIKSLEEHIEQLRRFR